ncbi:DUF5979 domain-containing protein [Agromyces sp. NPDC058104]|uniref:DUF5979 domain-containing protein n=1 Tax=Agromyces sp. NPDC058104 TaxID=3346342 RepID=UPI0036D75FAA
MSIVRRTLAGAAALLMAVGLAAPAAAPAFAAPDDAEFILAKSVVPDDSPYGPGDQFSYTIELTCNSNLVDTCVNAVLSDTLPSPLVFDPSVEPPVEVNGGGASTVTVDGSDFTVDFETDGSAGTGLPSGQKVTITVFVEIPTDVSADVNDAEIVNTATATADNALTVEESAAITIEVPEVLDSTVTKSVDDHQPDGTPGVPALPDQPVDYTIGGGNASNRSVDEIVVQDPADGVASPFDGYFDFTGITSITPPAGADQVEIEWLDADGNWTSAYGPGPIPADPSGIPVGVPQEDVKGLRFTFSSSTGDQLPPSGDEPAQIGIGAATNDTVLGIPLDQSVQVPNTASSNVVVHDTPSTPKTAPGNVVVSNTGPFVEVTKNFANPNLLAGQQTTATIEATNGFRPVTEMVIQEPTPGQPNLADQGLTFAGFTTGVTWPPNATGATITYEYADGQTETLTAGTPNTLPDPELEDSDEVVGFTVTFTGPIIQNGAATVPFDVVAQPVDGEDVTSTNETTSIVTDQTGKSGDDTASDDSTRQPGRVSTTIDKNIARDSQWAVPGSTTDVSFIAHVNDQGPNASTVGSDVLVISDPADPQAGAVDPFWNAFDLSQIVAGVPANADLQVNYWDGSAWVPLPGGQLDGEGTLVLSVPGGTAPVTQEQIQGIQFVYTPKEGELLPPGFQAAPTITVETRDQFRDGSGSVADAAADADPLTVPNLAGSEVHNDNDVTPDDNTATDGDQIDLDPIDGGDGPDLFEKHWLIDAADPLFAFTEDRRTARISWSTEGVPFETVAITDDPTAGPGYDDTTIANSAFDAWNLVEIAPIDASLDASMQYDRVSKVELFAFDDAAGTGEWVDITSKACATAADCDGAFPGYVLEADEVQSTRAVRLTYAEGSARGGAGQPTAGSGVAPSYGHDRDLDLVFELRDFTRSTGGPVTGTLHTEDFNSGQPGVVNNTAQIQGEGPQPIEQTDDDLITILDATVNVSVSKTFDQASLPIPPETTPAETYPLVNATITARNETEAEVQTLSVADPAPGSSTNTYDLLNLYAIDTITVPDAATSSTVTLTREGGGTTDYTIEEALALTSTELVDVIGFSVVHTDADEVVIESKATASVVLTFQLRKTERSNPANPVTTADLATNVAGATVERPGGDPAIDSATGTGTDTLPFAAASYGVVAQKDIQTPPTSADRNDRVEDEPREGYTIALTGQPTGNVRTTVLTITDDDPTFWNQFEFAAFPAATLPSPVRQVRVSALTGVDYAFDGGTNVLSQSCDGASDLTDCWTVGEWQTADAGGVVTPVLPGGVAEGDVLGLRFEFRVDDAASNWENPINPVVPIAFTANQLIDLRYGPNGETDVPVPSTQPGIAVPVAPGETAAGTTTDTVDVHGEGSWTGEGGTQWSADDDATDATVLKHLVNGISVVKTPGNGSDGAAAQKFPPSGAIPYRMTVTNTGQWPITGLELTDQVATDANGSLLVPRPNVTPTFGFTLIAADGTVLDASGFAGELDTTTGLVTITVPDGFVFEPGERLVITAALQFRAALPPGTPVGNTITATSDRTFDTCDSSSLGTITNPQTTDVESCAANTTVTPSAAAPISLVKGVKGTAAGVPGAPVGDQNHDDLGVLNTTGDATGCAEPNSVIAGFYRSNCVPITRPGGVETWALSFTNLGNVPAESIAGIDVLPAIGDTGVTVGTARGSQWSPIFLGNITALERATEASATFAYMTTVPNRACNAKDIEWSTRTGSMPTTDPCYADVSTRDWIPFTNTTPLAELATAKAIKAVVVWQAGQGLAPGHTGALTFDTLTPLALPNADDGGLPIAWNAVAAGSRADFSGTEIYQGPVEPVRSGVAVPTGEIALQKAVDLPADWPETIPLPESYDFDVQCTSGGEAVTLVDPSGASATPVTVPADGTVVDYGTGTNLPLYADCTVQEVPSQGATVTYDPADPDDPTKSGPVEAKRDLSGLDDVHHGAPADGALEQVTVTNTYELGGFYVVKDVVDGGAVDQDGEPIEIDPDLEFEFTASCIFLGEEVIPESDRTFTLKDGDQKIFDALPVGAECTVVETGAGGATDTTITVAETDGEDQVIDGDTAEFEIRPDVDNEHVTALGVVNTYTVGSISVTKDVTGAGAAAAADSFEVRLVCTWDQATTNPVYDATHTIADGETWPVDDLPTGAECTVTEPDTGGATQVVITPDQPITIGVAGEDGDPVVVTVTNDYRLGGFEIAKTVSGPGAGFSEGVDFEFDYLCTYDGATVGEGTLTVAGDGTAGPLTSEAVTGLPVGAECTVTETDAGGADALPEPVVVTIPDEVDGNAQVTTAEVDNRFSAGTVSVTKALAGEASDDPDFVNATYTVHVTCSLTEGGTPLFDGDVEVTGGQTVTVTDPATGDPLLLPLGTHCWGEETDDAGATSSSVDFDSFDDAVVVVADDGDEPQPLELTATNTFDLADLVIEKALDGDAASYAEDKTFQILVTCTLDRGPGNDPVVSYDQEPVELQGGEQATLTGIPIGSDCYAEEPDGQGAWEIRISATADDPVTVDGGETPITITVTNVYPDAGFSVTKQIETDAVDQDGNPIETDLVFRFHAICTFEGETVLDVEFELRDGATQSFDGLPAGADCTVEETAARGAVTSMVVTQNGESEDLGETSSAEFVLQPDVDDQAVNAVTITNFYPVGSVEIVKSVTGTGADAWGGTFGDFEVRLVCTVPVAVPDVVYDATHTLTKDAPGDVWIVENLPTTAECQVTELDDGGATQSTVTPETFVVGDDATAEPVRVDIVNDFRTGALDVLKHVAGPGAPAFSEGEYTFQVVCTYEGETVVDQELVVESDGGEGPFTSETITGIPVDAVCVVTETDPGHADEPAAPVTVTIPDQAEEGVETVVTAGFVNEFSLGTVELTKDVDGDAADAEWVVDEVFTVQVTCQLEVDGAIVTLYDAPVEIRGGETVEIVDAEGDPVQLPLGTRCFGVETDDGGATASSVDFGSYDDAAIVVESDTAQLLTLTATNTFDSGSLELEKTVSGAVDQADGKTFEIELMCVFDRGGNEQFIALDETVSIAAGETKAFGDLPIGAECWAEETDAGGAAEVTVSATEASPAVVGADEAVTITVDNRFDPPMAATGVDGERLALWIGGALLLVGAGFGALLIARRRRRAA